MVRHTVINLFHSRNTGTIIDDIMTCIRYIRYIIYSGVITGVYL